MSRILAVHASPRGERSQSRRLAEVFLAAYREAHPQARVARREVGRVPLPAVTEPSSPPPSIPSRNSVRWRCRPTWR